MTAGEAYRHLCDQLRPMHGERETRSMARALFEDLFELSVPVPDVVLKADDVQRFEQSLERLLKGEPVQYVTGVAHFYGIRLNIKNTVLIPRPETEELVHWILNDTADLKKQLDVLDIGTGSGCIPIALKSRQPKLRVFALEISLDALNVARVNARRLGLAVQFFRIDILEEEHWHILGKMDVIVSNPPYVRASERDLLLKQVVDYEPSLALFVSDEDPLLYYRTIAKFAHDHLRPEGRIYVEIHEQLADAVEQLFRDSGFQHIVVKQDMQGKDRMIRAEL